MAKTKQFSAHLKNALMVQITAVLDQAVQKLKRFILLNMVGFNCLVCCFPRYVGPGFTV